MANTKKLIESIEKFHILRQALAHDLKLEIANIASVFDMNLQDRPDLKKHCLELFEVVDTIDKMAKVQITEIDWYLGQKKFENFYSEEQSKILIGFSAKSELEKKLSFYRPRKLYIDSDMIDDGFVPIFQKIFGLAEIISIGENSYTKIKIKSISIEEFLNENKPDLKKVA